MVRTLHFDCFSGISGDMTLGALVDAGVDPMAIRAAVDSLGLPITLTFEKQKRGGIAGTYAIVDAPDQKNHRHLPEIERYIGRSSLNDRQKGLATRIFRKLGEAEAAVHGTSIEKMHFHEVGALDSIADIVGSAVAIDLLNVERITSRSVPPGSGTVKAAHGVMPVPAPATALLLKGIPLASVPVTGEMTTPTGAAILACAVHEWIDQPTMTIGQIGHGLGTKDFPDWANVLRVMVGDVTIANPEEQDTVLILETNLDDVPGEIIGYCVERLFAAGALDVFRVPIQMKKDRPGVLLSVIATPNTVAALESILFRETGTFGVRRTIAQRSKLRREACEIVTPWGTVKGKRGWREGLMIVAPEYEDCARVAREQGIPLRDVYNSARRAMETTNK